MSLTDLSYYARKFAPFAIFAFVVILIFFYSFKLLFLLFSLNQPKTVYTHTIFKQIKPLYVKKEATTSAGFSFTLDTVAGQPITATETAQVFLFPPSKFQFDYISKVYLMAKMLGFDTEKVKHKLVNNEAVFQDAIQRLAIDINTYNFRYDYDFRKDADLVEGAETPDVESSKNTAINFLKSIDRYPKDLALGDITTIPMFYDKTASTAGVVASPQESNMIEVDFYRQKIGEYLPMSPTYFNSQNYVMLIPNKAGAKVVSAQIRFFETSPTQIGVYPLITGKRAYEMLLSGKGILISEGSGKKQISIKSMTLGYFDPDTYQDYYQPIYVFTGDNDFVSYVPAVSEDWLIDESKL
ncbi:MAG: hypothetical protein NTZ55_05385 [Candidatus Roizmanbacteria bacterium]|nr:hypothetical protein [Candidatus Roizmanbacteria bacterium]